MKTFKKLGITSAQVDILIVPTAGLLPDGSVPEGGIERLRVAAEIVEAGNAKVVLILGGWRLRGPSEAEAYLLYVSRELPHIKHDTCLMTQAEATCTNRDLVAANSLIGMKLASMGIDRADARIGAVSYKEHLFQIEIVLRWLGFKNLFGFDTEQPVHYSQMMLDFIMRLTEKDPGWHGVLGNIMVMIANRRAMQVPREATSPKLLSGK